MKSIITHKLQGDGVNSWIERFYSDEETKFVPENEVQQGVIHYDDPTAAKSIDLANLDVTKIPADQLPALAELLKPYL